MPLLDRSRWPRAEVIVAAIAAIAAAVVALAFVSRKSPSSSPAAAPGDSVRHRPIAGGEFEISGVAHVPGSNQLLVLDDDTTREVFLIEVATDSSQLGNAVPVPLGADVRTWKASLRRHAFLRRGVPVETHGFDGVGLVRFRFDPVSRRASNVRRSATESMAR